MSENILLSNTIAPEVQTERPHVTVTRYFEAAIQTDDQVDRFCSDAKSMTSTQAGGEDQSAHTRTISLDMSPIKRMDRTDAALEPILEHAEVESHLSSLIESTIRRLWKLNCVCLVRTGKR